jgi:hypothetical protein
MLDETQGQTPPEPIILNPQEYAKEPVAQQPAPPPLPIEEPVAPAEPKRKVWGRGDIVRSVKCPVHLPNLYPDFAPWVFELRLKLSIDAEERRAEYMALAPSEQTVKEQEQNLDELCDLLMSAPTGFADLKDNGAGPGPSFRDYVMTSDAATKETLFTIVRGAINLYGRKTSPHEFLGKI